jgi:uncharacterized protein (DUF885 family)
MKKSHRQRLSVLALCVCLLLCAAETAGCSTGSGSGASENARFEAFLDNLFCEELSQNTLNLHYTLADPSAYGIRDYTVSLGEFSTQAQKESLSELKETQKLLQGFSTRSLSEEELLTYDTLSAYVENQLALSDFSLFTEPLTPNNGVQSQLPILFAEYTFRSKTDVEDYLALLEQTDSYFSQILAFEEEKADAGLFMSDDNCSDVISCCEDFLENKESNFLLSTFETRIAEVDGLSTDEISSYVEKNRAAVYGHVFPAYENMILGLTNLLGCGKNDWGLCNYEDGAAYYEALVQSETGCSDSIEELDAWISARRESDLASCEALLAQDSGLLEKCSSFSWDYADENEMLDTLCSAMLSDFPAPAVSDYEVCGVEECLSDFLAPAFYITAPLDDATSNRIYVNSAKSYPDIYYFTTLAHEGFPGHLYQTVMSYDYGLSPIRALLDFPGYTEGWATYVEMISYDYAGLDENVAAMLMHNQSAMLSLYASSDIGIHYYGWEASDMYEFWGDYGITDHSVVDAIARLILGDPGNYLKYYVGYLNFVQLRDDMEEAYGNSFSLPAFHEAVLRMGPAPFDVLKEHFAEYYGNAD